MKLCFSPMACSLATRIALYEAGADAQYTRVDLKSKTLADGSSFLDLNPMGQVPVLVADDNAVLTENTAVLQYVADRFPHAKLAPASGFERARLQQWLGFIGTELHKAVFAPLFDRKAPDSVKPYAREKIPQRLAVLQNHLSSREFLLDSFTVADAYLTTVLNWSASIGLELAPWPAVHGYHQRLVKRPSIAKAVAEEWAMYKEEQARQAKA